jgi:hypothetical protein
MMQAGRQGVELIEADGKVIGISFGADAVTEHERGIQALRVAFGMDNNAKGIERCRVRVSPPGGFLWVDDGHDAILVYGASDIDLDSLRGNELRLRTGDLACAWDHRSFGIRGRGPMRLELRKFRDALADHKAALMMSSMFLMKGLALILVDEFPDDINQQMIEREGETARRLKLWMDSGIEKLLRKAGKSWFSLGHKVIEKDGVYRTWLNPCEQHLHRCGWWTFEELRQWASDEGPVMVK